MFDIDEESSSSLCDNKNNFFFDDFCSLVRAWEKEMPQLLIGLLFLIDKWIQISKFFQFLFLFAACSAGDNEKRLLHDLLDSYNTLERPVVNESDPLQLSFGLTLMQIIDVVSLATAPCN